MHEPVGLERMAMLRETVALVSEMRVEDRLRARLHQLADRFGIAAPSGVRLSLDLTHAQWASLVAGCVADMRPSCRLPEQGALAASLRTWSSTT